MKTVKAGLNIELNILCPHCDEYIDLMQINGLNDEGELLKAACPRDGFWVDSHDTFEQKFDCPECKKEIHVHGIEW